MPSQKRYHHHYSSIKKADLAATSNFSPKTIEDRDRELDRLFKLISKKTSKEDLVCNKDCEMLTNGICGSSGNPVEIGSPCRPRINSKEINH